MFLPKLPENFGKIFPIVLILGCAGAPAIAQAPANTTPPSANAAAPAPATTPEPAPSVAPAAPAAEAAAPTPAAEKAPSADDKLTPGTGSSQIPHDLSPYGMFVHADIIVQVVMVGLGFASLVTWTILLVKTIELFAARRRATTALADIAGANSLREASGRFTDSKAPVARLVNAALDEEQRSYGLPADGVKERATALLARIETRAGRTMGARHRSARDDRLDGALRRPVRHGLGHHERVHRHLAHQHDEPRCRGAGHRRGAARHRLRPYRRHSLPS